jgi:hypothetical protein
MSTSSLRREAVTAKDVRITSQSLIVELNDGREVSVPLSWYPRLTHGSIKDRRQWQFVGPGIGIHWPTLDEDISIEGLLQGFPSGESAASFRRWLASRERPATRRLQPTTTRRRTKAARGERVRLQS